jgi:hypothetical protein
MMRYFLITMLCIISNTYLLTQPLEKEQWLRSFPITDYMVDINDSVKLVQIQLPDGIAMKEKTVGILYGVYQQAKTEVEEKGVGRCHLIKGDYYYFSITLKKNTAPPATGDLLYVRLPSTQVYNGFFTKMAGHFIELTNVNDSAFFNRYKIFSQWTQAAENDAIQAMVNDIKWTGNYFNTNNPDADQLVKSGVDKGKSTLALMINCTSAQLHHFFEYILARPRNYAGKNWKISEIFATWLVAGAPTVIK